jgi:hypothetical protein
MSESEPRDESTSSPSEAERDGIVDQQAAALSAIEEVEGADDDDPMQGEAPTG